MIEHSLCFDFKAVVSWLGITPLEHTILYYGPHLFPAVTHLLRVSTGAASILLVLHLGNQPKEGRSTVRAGGRGWRALLR